MGEQYKITEYPKQWIRLLWTKRNKTLSTNSNTNPTKLRIGNLNNFKLYSSKRFFYTSSLLANTSNFSKSPYNTDLNLNPFFLTGFTDGDGSFSILVSKDIKGKCKVQPVFIFGLHKKDLPAEQVQPPVASGPLLLMIQKYFAGIGKIYTRNDGRTVDYNINSVKDIIKYVIPHFDNYPLVTVCFFFILFFRRNLF